MASRLEKINSHLDLSEPEILKYRRLSKIDTQQLKDLAYGPNLPYREKVFDMILSNRDVFQHNFIEEADRKTERKKSAEEVLFYGKNNLQTYYEFAKNPNSWTLIGNAFCAFDPGLAVKIGVHLGLYVKAIFNLGTKVHQKYMERGFAFKDVGCFGLTELAHGSNARGIKTEAHYCHKTKSFILHTPTRQDMKFWIGAAANLANMSVIFAQLYIDGQCYGVHAYVVPIRDPETHEPYPGVTIGDCGHKNGLNAIDNGFIMFDRYRIPKENQLNRLSGVDEHGKFTTTMPNQDKRFAVLMGTLSGGRMILIFNSMTIPINCITIAVRYVLGRRQFSAPKSLDEVLLFDYPLTKSRLMPLLAQTLVMTLAGQQLIYDFDNNLHNLLDPKNKMMAELHGISSVAKPLVTWFTLQLIKECRQMLGGHGYSAFSRLGSLYNDADVNTTWQGDNYVLLQQGAKFLLDSARKAMKGKQLQARTLTFLTQPPEPKELSEANIEDLHNFQKIFESRVARRLQAIAERLSALKDEGKNTYESWLAVQASYVIPLCLSYAQLFYLQSILRCIHKCRHTDTRIVIENCSRLWIYKILVKQNYGDEEIRKLLITNMQKYCQKVAMEAVGITDALAPPADIIGSPFADENGNGMKKYYNMIFMGKETFRKVEWFKQIVNRERKM